MKKVLLWLCVGGVMLALTVCQQPLGPGDQGAGELDARARSGEMVKLLIESQATGNSAALEAMLAEDDPDGELRQILIEGGAFAVASAKELATALALPAFADPGYDNGDVLVSRGSGHLTASLMGLILESGYGHAGILNTDLADDPEGACVLSADADYLTGAADASLNYENYLDWCTKNDVITVLGYTGGYTGVGAGIEAIAALSPGTIYAFLGYPGAPVGAFEPIEKTDNGYWYCSKVPYRVYDHIGDDIEASEFYGALVDPSVPGSPQRWELLKDSVLYKVYLFYLKLQHPWWWPLRWLIPEADNHLWHEERSILKELVSPDELRASSDLEWKFTVCGVDVFTDPETFDDAPLVEWPIGTYPLAGP